MRLSWTREEVDARLLQIMQGIHAACVQYGKRPTAPSATCDGANIAGFVKVADAMIAPGRDLTQRRPGPLRRRRTLERFYVPDSPCHGPGFVFRPGILCYARTPMSAPAPSLPCPASPSLAQPPAAKRRAPGPGGGAAAARHTCGIISVDSALVYRGMDIGTAKPSASEQASVPAPSDRHPRPQQAYSAAEFVQDASRLVAEIRARVAHCRCWVGRHHAVLQGAVRWHRRHAARRCRRACAHQCAGDGSEGWPALHAELARVDPATAARLAPATASASSDALEVAGVRAPLSSFHTPLKGSCQRRRKPLQPFLPCRNRNTVPGCTRASPAL